MLNPVPPGASALAYILCYSLAEAQCLLGAQARFREGNAGIANPGDDVVDRMVAALNADSLPAIYSVYLKVLYDADAYRDIRTIAAELKLSPTQIGAMASKLSARLKKVATSSELRDLVTPLHLLISIRYEQGTKEASHKLTDPHGRAAVKRFLALA